MNSFLQTLKSLGPVRLAALGGVGLATLLFLIVVIARLGGEPMTTVFTGLNASDGGAIVQRLEQLNIPYEASADGSRVSVPEAQAGRVKMLLAQEGIPSGGGVGYEIFNQPEGFGTTSFLQNINQQRALEGELARTIRSMQGIGNARVQLVLPRRELFARDAAQARASVFLELRGGAFGREQISSIQHLIASAVPQLEPGRVAIIDARGNLLAAGTGTDSISAQQASAEEQKIAIEQRLSQRVEEILGRTVGFEKVRAQVTVELDMDSITTQSETFDPESQVARSTQSVTESSQTNEPAPAGGDSPVSVQNNLPGGATGSATPANAAPATIPTNKSNRTEETTNFEISRTTQSQTRTPGSIRRVSVAVLVDGTYKTEGEGEEAKEVYQPRTEQELEQYAALVRSAVGFDADRGDIVEVANLQFAEQNLVAAGNMVEQLTSNPEIMRLAEKLGMLLLAILVLLVIVRPMVKTLLDVKPAVEKDAAAALAGPTASSAIAQQLEAAENAMEEVGQDNMIDLNRVDGRVKASSLKKMGEIIEKHPEEAVAIIRQWIYAES
jgi:flagellar M-ring protein FliF